MAISHLVGGYWRGGQILAATIGVCGLLQAVFIWLDHDMGKPDNEKDNADLDAFKQKALLLFGLAGYFGVIAPMILTAASGRPMAHLLALVVATFSSVEITWHFWSWREAVALRLSTKDGKTWHFLPSGLCAISARAWFVPASLISCLIMLGAVGLVHQTPEQIAVNTLVSGALLTLTYFAMRVVVTILPEYPAVPKNLVQNLPSLRARLAIASGTLRRSIYLVMLLVLALALLGEWTQFSLSRWLSASAGQATLTHTVTIFVISLAIWLVVSTWLEARFRRAASNAPNAYRKSAFSVISLVVTATLLIIATLLILSELGLNITPILAGLGVVGLVIGWGSQQRIKGLIAGFAIHRSDVLRKGDFISASGVSGTIEEVTLDQVGLRSMDGTYHFVPYSSVSLVSNMTRDFGVHVCDLGPIDLVDLEEVHRQAKVAYEGIAAGALGELLDGDFGFDGVVSFSEVGVTVRIRVRCKAGQHWAVGRAFDEAFLRRLKTAGVDIQSSTTHLELDGNVVA